MSKKIYICNNCGFVFPDELKDLIEEKVQVYCERCGTPFSLEGVKFSKIKPEKSKKKIPPIEATPRKQIVEKDESGDGLKTAIEKLNDFSSVPVVIVSIIALALIAQIVFSPGNWIIIISRQLTLGLAGLTIAIYDMKYISKKIKAGDFNSIFLDAFCFGILGCVLFGTGVIILVKGILIIIYVFSNQEEKDFKIYDFGLFAKDSINHFSARAGITIILFAFTALLNGTLKIGNIWIGDMINDPTVIMDILFRVIAVGMFFIWSVMCLIIDYSLRDKLNSKLYFDFPEALRTFILGIFATLFYSTGIFILLKGILIFILLFAKPDKVEPEYHITKKEETKPELKGIPQPIKTEKNPQREKTDNGFEELEQIPIVKDKKEGKEIAEKKEKVQEEIIKLKEEEEKIEEEKGSRIDERIKAQKKESIKVKEVKEKQAEDKEQEMELKLHESLYPVKNEKDKKLVKEYFAKIFKVLSKDIKERIDELDIPKNQRKEILRELAFLTKEEQIKYIDTIVNLYQKEIPQKLIKRIKKLSNVKPEYYPNIIEQLKYMDSEEQLEFILFLEKFT